MDVGGARALRMCGELKRGRVGVQRVWLLHENTCWMQHVKKINTGPRQGEYGKVGRFEGAHLSTWGRRYPDR